MLSLHPRVADPRCRLCGSTSLRLAYTQGDRDQYRFYRCVRCRLVNYDLSGGLDQEKYAAQMPRADDDGARHNRGATASYRALSRHANPPGRLLDIGCGNGRILHLARRDGWNVCGLELSEPLASRVTRQIAIPVATGSFLDDDVEERIIESTGWSSTPTGGLVDVVVLRHVLEHLPDTLGALDRIGTLLARGGIALLELPNVDAWDLRLKRVLSRVRLRRKRYRPDYVPGHCNEFCRVAFSYALALGGFELIGWRTYSMRPVANAIYGVVPVGNKARALIRARAVDSPPRRP